MIFYNKRICRIYVENDGDDGDEDQTERQNLLRDDDMSVVDIIHLERESHVWPQGLKCTQPVAYSRITVYCIIGINTYIQIVEYRHRYMISFLSKTS